MIFLLPGDSEKFALLDKFLRAITIEDFNALVESDLVAGKLRGAPLHQEVGPIQGVINEHNRLEQELMNTRSELMMLRSDIQTLAKLVLKPYDYNSANDAQTLKSKYSIF